jgi:hypothetical protein
MIHDTYNFPRCLVDTSHVDAAREADGGGDIRISFPTMNSELVDSILVNRLTQEKSSS